MRKGDTLEQIGVSYGGGVGPEIDPYGEENCPILANRPPTGWRRGPPHRLSCSKSTIYYYKAWIKSIENRNATVHSYNSWSSSPWWRRLVGWRQQVTLLSGSASAPTSRQHLIFSSNAPLVVINIIVIISTILTCFLILITVILYSLYFSFYVGEGGCLSFFLSPSHSLTVSFSTFPLFSSSSSNLTSFFFSTLSNSNAPPPTTPIQSPKHLEYSSTNFLQTVQY